MERLNLNGYQRSRPTLGELRTINEQINELPAVGSEVFIYENVLLPERAKRKTGLVTQYLPSDSYRNAFGEPLTFKVDSYTKGIETPLDDDNWISLIKESKSSTLYRTSIKTVLVATGHFKLVPINEHNKMQGEEK